MIQGLGNGRWSPFAKAAARLTALVFLASGCGDLTSGGFGEVEVELAADSVSDLPASSSGVVAAAAPSGWMASTAGSSPDRGSVRKISDIVGTLTVRAGVAVRRVGGGWIAVTDAPAEVTLALDGGGTTVVARRDGIPAGSYDRVRIVFGRVEANVERGLFVDGDTIRGRVPVELESDERILVERPLSMAVTDGGTTLILLELRTPHWLRRVDRVDRRVTSMDFRNLIRIRVAVVGP